MMPWYRSPAVNWLAAVLLPPVGLVLLWIRHIGYFKKILGSLVIGLIMMAHLFLLFGMRVELDGSGARPIFSFRDKEKHFAAIDVDRTAAPVAVPAAPAAQPPATVVAAAAPESAAPAPAAEAKPAPYWTDYRGPLRDGHYRQTPVLDAWPANGLRRLWKIPIGLGYSSMVIADGRLYTIDQRRDKEVVAAYDAASGRELWAHSYPAFFQEGMGGDGPRATPVWHEGLLYSMGATGWLKVLDAATGKVKWEKDILKDNGAQNLTWGMSAAPLIVDEKVIVQPGGMEGKSVVAYHKLTGERVWSSLNDQQAYTSPMLVTLAGRRQIVTATALRFVGLDAADGKLLWEFPWTTEYDVNAAQPLVVGDNRLFISAGYDHGAALLEIEKSGDGLAAKQVWFNKKMKNKFSSSVLHEGHIYGMDEAIMACVRVSDGQQTWKGGRYGYGQLLLAGGNLVVISESGELVLVKATPEKHTELAKFPAIEGKTWNVPAMADGVLFVRNLAEMAAFRIGE
jgi:outer membrane protein assembly factor BamB